MLIFSFFAPFGPRRFLFPSTAPVAWNLQLCFGRARVSKTWHEFAGESNFEVAKRGGGGKEGRAFRKFATQARSIVYGIVQRDLYARLNAGTLKTDVILV